MPTDMITVVHAEEMACVKKSDMALQIPTPSYCPAYSRDVLKVADSPAWRSFISVFVRIPIIATTLCIRYCGRRFSALQSVPW